MALTANIATGKQRFEALLGGTAAAAHDRPLLERPGWLVAPTLGAIVPDWLLAIPRCRVLSFRDWGTIGGEHPETVLRDVREHLGVAREDVIWFEHGPSVAGSTVGCGLDHAHIHILVRPNFTFAAFAMQARKFADLEWRECSGEHSYAAVEGDASYFIAGGGDRVISALHVESAGSQFFRRVIGALVGKDTAWNYQRFAHADNIARTIGTFRSLESASRRDG